MQRGHNYSLEDYRWMILDKARMGAYAEALGRIVKPGSVVADIGAGTGIFSLMAAKLGARRVYAIEPEDAVDVGRKVANDNGVADRIEFIRALSTEVELPEPADVIVAELRGALPFFNGNISAVIDARQRLLAPGGTLIPLRDTVWTSTVENVDVYDRYAGPPPERCYGIDFSATYQGGTRTWGRGRVRDSELLSAPVRWAVIDYATVESTDASGETSHTIRRDGTLHGVLVWFEAELVAGVTFGTGPGTKTVYGSSFFPLTEPIDVSPGDQVQLRLEARFVSADYVWRWRTRVLAGDGTTKAAFDQNQTILPPNTTIARLERRRADRVIALDDDGELTIAALSLIDGTRSLGEIARLLTERFPERFQRWEDALGPVADLADQYGVQPDLRSRLRR